MESDLTEAQQMVLAFLGERCDSGDAPPTVREICQHFGYRSTRAASDHLGALQKKGFVAREKNRSRGIRLIRRNDGVPLLGRIPAGHPRNTVAEPRGRLSLNPTHYGIHDRSKAFALFVSGDSMTGRHLFDGDIVLLESGVEPRDGDIVAALIDNESTLKTLVVRGRKAWLRAENPNYPDLIPAWDLQIQGVARAVVRLLRK